MGKLQQVNPASARVNAQKLLSLHKYKRINTPSVRQPGKSGVAKLSILLTIESNTLVVRNHKEWTKSMQETNAGMLFRGKKEYEWEELPTRRNNQRKEKAKPDSLGERIVFKGDEQKLYSKFVYDSILPFESRY